MLKSQPPPNPPYLLKRFAQLSQLYVLQVVDNVHNPTSTETVQTQRHIIGKSIKV